MGSLTLLCKTGMGIGDLSETKIGELDQGRHDRCRHMLQLETIGGGVNFFKKGQLVVVVV
jgi:hypothetical protein